MGENYETGCLTPLVPSVFQLIPLCGPVSYGHQGRVEHSPLLQQRHVDLLLLLHIIDLKKRELFDMIIYFLHNIHKPHINNSCNLIYHLVQTKGNVSFE